MYNSPIALLKGIKTNFSNLLLTTPGSYFDPLITRVSSNSDEEKYYLLDSLPGFKEWTDERHFGDLSDDYFQVINKDWDGGIRVMRNTINDSRANLGGEVEARIKAMVQKYKSFPDKVCTQMLSDNPTCFDGTALFATSRNLDTGSNTINNLYSGTASTTYSASEFSADFDGARTLLWSMLDKDNEPFNDNVSLVAMVSPALASIASNLFATSNTLIYISGTISNTFAGAAKVIVNPRMSGNDWYLYNENAPFKPFIIQDRESPKWNMWDDTKKKFIEYGVDFRMGYNVFNPLGVIKINN